MVYLLAGSAILARILESSEFGQMRLWAYAVFLHGLVLAAGAAAVFLRARRRRTGCVIAFGCVGLVSIAFDAFLVEPTWLELTRIELRTSKLERSVRIAVVADFQADEIGDYERNVIAHVIRSDPDIVLFAGDYVQVSWDQYAEVSTDFHALMEGLSSNMSGQMYAVRGDVDHQSRWPELFAGLDVTTFEKTGAAEHEDLLVTGLSRDASSRSNLVLAGDSRFHIVFGHRPDFARGRVDADLLIAAHTHGGQVRLPLLGPVTTRSSIPRAWSSGRTELSGGRTLIVSRGIGMERQRAPQMRFLCRPELLIVDLVPASGSVPHGDAISKDELVESASPVHPLAITLP